VIEEYRLLQSLDRELAKLLARAFPDLIFRAASTILQIDYEDCRPQLASLTTRNIKSRKMEYPLVVLTGHLDDYPFLI